MKRIIHLSDPHFGAADDNAAQAFLKRIRAEPPDLTILSGDLTMRARRVEMEAARHFVHELPTPLIVIPGNHDMPAGNHPVERMIDPFRRYRDGIQENLEPELVHDGMHVVSLNSSRSWGFYADWSEGRLSKKQLAYAESRFKAFPDANYRILVLHHPLIQLQLPGRAVVKPLAPLLDCLENSCVDLVLCGHFHRSMISPVGRNDAWHALVSQAPTVCSTRLQGEPQGYHEIFLEDEQAKIIHRVYDDGDFSASTVTAFARTDDGWSQAHLPL